MTDKLFNPIDFGKNNSNGLTEGYDLSKQAEKELMCLVLTHPLFKNKFVSGFELSSGKEWKYDAIAYTTDSEPITFEIKFTGAISNSIFLETSTKGKASAYPSGLSSSTADFLITVTSTSKIGKVRMIPMPYVRQWLAEGRFEFTSKRYTDNTHYGVLVDFYKFMSKPDDKWGGEDGWIGDLEFTKSSYNLSHWERTAKYWKYISRVGGGHGKLSKSDKGSSSS